MFAGMLRITLPSRADHPVFVLEGKLSGLWVKELIRVTRLLGPGTNSVFDIEGVSFVDSLGEKALLWLNKLGAAFIAENVYGKDLCLRLHLHRTSEAKAGVFGQPEHRVGKTLSATSLPLS
jgi:hypothetical protein